MNNIYRYVEDAPARGCLVVMQLCKVEATIHIAHNAVEGTHIQSYSESMTPEEAQAHVRVAFEREDIFIEDDNIFASAFAYLTSNNLDYIVGIEILDNLEEMSI